MTVQLGFLEPPSALPEGFAYCPEAVATEQEAELIARFRCKIGAGWRRAAIELMPRSAYLLRGDARWAWEHSIPPAEALRYSVTFRTVRAA